MSAEGSSGAQKIAPQSTPNHLRWDANQAESLNCALATANSMGREIVLNFGVKRSPEGRPAEIEVELVRRIALSPLAAQNLVATLKRLIQEQAGDR